jgi:hypothetical protein
VEHLRNEAIGSLSAAPAEGASYRSAHFDGLGIDCSLLAAASGGRGNCKDDTASRYPGLVDSWSEEAETTHAHDMNLISDLSFMHV